MAERPKNIVKGLTALRAVKQRRPAPQTVVVMGGGTGTFTVLSALRDLPVHLQAVVAMTDDGGSSGVLRDELGVLPPGDIRQCLVALSDAPQVLRNIFQYRFDNGTLKGHSFGNLFLSALEKATGSFQRGLEEVSSVLRIRGEVIPVTLDNVRLVMKLNDGTVLRGERSITPSSLLQKTGIASYAITPRSRANPKAIAAIRGADCIIVGPGNLYTSIAPLFLVPGVKQAFRRSRALKVLMVNLMTKEGQTEGFSVSDFVAAIEKFTGAGAFDAVLFNTKRPSAKALLRYVHERSLPIRAPQRRTLRRNGARYVGADLLSSRITRRSRSDSLIAKVQTRSVLRHDREKLRKAITALLRQRLRTGAALLGQKRSPKPWI